MSQKKIYVRFFDQMTHRQNRRVNFPVNQKTCQRTIGYLQIYL